MKIELGDEVKDSVTGFKGIVTAIAKCITGCDRLEVRQQTKANGEMKDAYWIDVIGAKVTKKNKAGIKKEVKKAKKKGGPPAKSTR